MSTEKAFETGPSETGTISAPKTARSTLAGAEEALQGAWRRGAIVLDLSLHEDPVPWSRTRGGHGQRFNPPKLVAWEGQIQERASQEIAILGLDLPTKDPLWVEILVQFKDQARFNRAGDPDNLQKAILDALRGVVWVDDRVSNLPVVRFAAWPGPAEEVGKVSILVCRCELA